MSIKSNKVKNTKGSVKTHKKTSVRPTRQKTKHNDTSSHFVFFLLEILKLPVLFLQLIFALAWLAVSLAIAGALLKMII